MCMRFGLAGNITQISFIFDGEPVTAFRGDTIASALYATGVRSWRRSTHGEERGVFCGIGVCMDCLVTVDGHADQRACQILVSPGMVVETNMKG